MARRRRPHLPGVTYHLTARTQGREALFTPELRTAFVALLRKQVAFSDLEVFAYAVMPNHLHLVVRQGRAPLWHFMQPLLCRTALLLQRAHGREGHIFERRYRDHPCGDPEYIRNAIVYTHLNPVRAGICEEPGEYPWSSHGAWLGDSAAADGCPHPVALELATQLFASSPARDGAGLSRDYLAFMSWRRECDHLQSDPDLPEVGATMPPRPETGRGDESWVVHLPPGGRDSQGPIDHMGSGDFRLPRPDLERIARGVVGPGRGGPDLDMVRSRWGGVTYVRLRHEIIRRAAAYGYRGVEIAKYLRISPNTVSAVLAARRRELLSSSRYWNRPAG